MDRANFKDPKEADASEGQEIGSGSRAYRSLARAAKLGIHTWQQLAAPKMYVCFFVLGRGMDKTDSRHFRVSF